MCADFLIEVVSRLDQRVGRCRKTQVEADQRPAFGMVLTKKVAAALPQEMGLVFQNWNRLHRSQ